MGNQILRKTGLKAALTLIVLALIVWLSPVAPIDPWNLLSPQKISFMILALTLIQIVGSVMVQIFGARLGFIMTGFFGGLVSSTATAASLARRSKVAKGGDSRAETLIFLSATCAMLIEGIALVLTGTTGIHISLLVVFLGPLLATVTIIGVLSRDMTHKDGMSGEVTFEILPIIRLAVLIIGILTLSKILQNLFGQNGLMILTFLVSLFEVHGSIIANVGLHDDGLVGISLLCSLMALSIVASYTSKLVLVVAIGSRNLKKRVALSSVVLVVALAVSWALSMALV